MLTDMYIQYPSVAKIHNLSVLPYLHKSKMTLFC